MNPLLSLSFLSSGLATAGAEPVANEADTALDNSDGANKFGRLLNQSGGQQQAADRQSFAGFSLVDNSKQLAGVGEQQTGRPGISLPEADLAAAELSLADDNNAVVLLGFLDLASQTRLQLTGQADKQVTEKGPVPTQATTQAGVMTEALAGSDPVAEINDGIKFSTGEWFMLPVDPALAEAASDTDNTTAALLAGLSKESDPPADPAVAMAETLSEQETDALAASKADEAAAASDSQPKPAVTVNPAGAVTPPGQAAASAQTDAEPDASTVSVGAKRAAIFSGVARAERMAGEKPATAAAELNTATSSNQPRATATIFDTAAVTIFDKSDVTAPVSEDGTAGSSLASAAAVAESALARQQQRAGLAETVNQTKQALAAGAEVAEHNHKGDAALLAGSQRPESSLSGFGSVLSPAGQSQGEAVAARMEAAILAGTQQTAERANKAQSVHKSVTEQLKQVNLLAQNATGQLRERVNLMVRQNIQVADIRLDPADLGQMQIRINLQQEQASVQFIVQQQHAKELLEQQMPRLREMLQQQGIQLGEGQVQQQRQGDSQGNGQSAGNSGKGQDSQQQGPEQATALQLEVKLSERIVDYYA